ncbi:MAG TPA: hypothetical protein VKV27_09910 [Solirubrobacteraceae bacterium]|nr:hypothetical protein [Solirubrobacteraceae bacterium]
MGSEADPAQLVGRSAHESLLTADPAQLPDPDGRPGAPPPSAARGRILAAGAAMTAVALIAGAILAAGGIAEGVLGGLGPGPVAMVVVGLVLVLTHWGWVHVAELVGQSLDRRRERAAAQSAALWLASVEPHAACSVASDVRDDGSIELVTVRHVPVACGERHFAFVREIVAREVHGPEEPAAVVAARAEELRRRAAEETASARAQLHVLAEAAESARLAAADEAERLAALRAESRALSDRINERLRDPQLPQ